MEKFSLYKKGEKDGRIFFFPNEEEKDGKILIFPKEGEEKDGEIFFSSEEEREKSPPFLIPLLWRGREKKPSLLNPPLPLEGEDIGGGGKRRYRKKKIKKRKERKRRRKEDIGEGGYKAGRDNYDFK